MSMMYNVKVLVGHNVNLNTFNLMFYVQEYMLCFI